MMFRLTRNHLNNRGDTIVEVLFATAIIASLLAGGYSLARLSIVEERRAQERGEALQLVQSQIESLKSYVVTAAQPPAASFCMSGLSVNTIPSNNCEVNGSGMPTTSEPIYNLSISISTTGSASVCTIMAQWNDVSGAGKDSITMYYRLYTQ